MHPFLFCFDVRGESRPDMCVSDHVADEPRDLSPGPILRRRPHRRQRVAHV
jgi:hypothetical protein